MIWMLAILLTGTSFTIGAMIFGTKHTTYISALLVVTFFVSALGQRIFETLQPWWWFAIIDFCLLLILRHLSNKRRFVALISYLVFASLSTSVIYGVADLAGFDFTPTQNFIYGSVLNGLVYLQFFAVGWGIFDDRGWFKRLGLFPGHSDHSGVVDHPHDSRTDRHGDSS